MTLMPYYHKESTYIISDIYSELIQLNSKSQTNLWNVFISRLPNFTKIGIPEHLKALEKIPMGHPIETLHDLQEIEKDKGDCRLGLLIIGAVIALLIVIAGFIYYKKGKYLKQLWFTQGMFLTPTAPPVYHAVPVKFGMVSTSREIFPLHSKGQTSTRKTKCQNH